MQSSSVRRVPPSAAFRRLLAAVLVPLGAALLPQPMAAQTTFTTGSGFISYQGNVTDAAGVGLGNTTPVNRTITFRIWKSATSFDTADLVYSEQQVATINKGEFSLLIGAGTQTVPTATGATLNIPYPETTKGKPTVNVYDTAVFDGTPRYLGVTVDDGTTAQDAEISPRQQLVATPYAFRARVAERVGSGSGTYAAIIAHDNGNVGIGTGATTPTSLLEVAGSFKTTGSSGTIVASGKISTTADITAQGAVSAGGASGYVFSNESNGGLFSPGAGIVTIRTAGLERVRVDGSGNVGIGTTAPTQRLHIAGNSVTTGTAYLLDLNHSIRAVHGEGVAISTHGAVDGLFLRQTTGNVGIGISNPSAKLDVNGSVRATGTDGFTFGGVGDADGGLYSPGDGIVTVKTNNTERVRIDSGGNVGIGTNSPLARFHVDGAIRQSSVGDFAVDSVGTFGGRLVVKETSGNVGIGTASPSVKLDVNGKIGVADGGTKTRNAGISTEVGGGLIQFGTNDSSTNRFGGTYTQADQGGVLRVDSRAYNLFQFHGRAAGSDAGTTELMTISSAGNVGIGTDSPTKGKVQIASSVKVKPDNDYGNNANIYGVLGTNGASNRGANTTDVDISLWAQQRIAAQEFNAFSDERIKLIQGRSDGHSDLAALLGIEITDYRFKDTILNGTSAHKKVIAQQVEKVFPQAVNLATDVVPDIFAKAEISEGWVQLATDLKVGERVRLIADKEEGIHEVLEVQTDRFRTAFKPAGEKVFVYGREVKDFRSVDYDAIAMLNVSATQEIKREKDAEVKALQEKNAALGAEVATLRSQLTALAAQEKARDAKLASIEKLLQSSQTVMAQPAKAATANGQE